MRQIKPPPTDAEVRAARANLIAWLHWYRTRHPHDEQAPTWTEVARRVGVAKSAISQLIQPGSERMPSLPTLMGIARLLGWGVDAILAQPPP